MVGKLEIRMSKFETNPKCEGSNARNGAELPAERRWPAWVAFLTAWWLPATTAERTNHFSLGWALLLHAVGWVFGTIMLLASGGGDVPWVIRRLLWGGRSLVPGMIVLFVASIELGSLILALLAMPWGARDEPIGASLRHSLRRTSLATPVVLMGILVAGVMFVQLFEARRQRGKQWDALKGSYMAARGARIRAGNMASAERRRKLVAAEAAVTEQFNAFTKGQSGPWYRRYGDEMIGYILFATGTWVLWGLFRAVGARRDVRPVVRTPMCESCGYDLRGAEPDGRCPECGELVADSLGPGARPGAIWERRRDAGRLRAWWRTLFDAIRRPTWFGRQLRRTATPSDHRRFAVLHLAPLFVIGTAGLWAVYLVDQGQLPVDREPAVAWALGPCVGYCSAAAAIILPVLAAGGMGIWCRLRGEHNLMSCFMQAACYLSGYVFLIVVVLLSAFLAIVEAEMLIWRVGRWPDLQVDRVMIALFVGIPLILVIGYIWLLARTARGFRYANR